MPIETRSVEQWNEKWRSQATEHYKTNRLFILHMYTEGRSYTNDRKEVPVSQCMYIIILGVFLRASLILKTVMLDLFLQTISLRFDFFRA